MLFLVFFLLLLLLFFCLFLLCFVLLCFYFVLFCFCFYFVLFCFALTLFCLFVRMLVCLIVCLLGCLFVCFLSLTVFFCLSRLWERSNGRRKMALPTPKNIPCVTWYSIWPAQSHIWKFSFNILEVFMLIPAVRSTGGSAGNVCDRLRLSILDSRTMGLMRVSERFFWNWNNEQLQNLSEQES